MKIYKNTAYFRFLKETCALLPACLAFISCTETIVTPNLTPGTSEEGKSYTIKAQTLLPDVWQPTTRADNEDVPYYGYTLFDGNGNFIERRGSAMANISTNICTFTVYNTGEYVIYAATNLFINEFPAQVNKKNTLDDIFPLRSPKEITLGKETLTITKDIETKEVVVATSHLGAKADFTITDVPAYINSITVTLPHQATGFKFDGTFVGNDNTQEIALTREETPASNETYTWTSPSTWVFPVATEATSMEIVITAKTVQNKILTFNTSVTDTNESHLCFHSNTNTSLTASWGTIDYKVSPSIVINAWDPVSQQGTLEDLNK